MIARTKLKTISAERFGNYAYRAFLESSIDEQEGLDSPSGTSMSWSIKEWITHKIKFNFLFTRDPITSGVNVTVYSPVVLENAGVYK